MDDWGLAGSSPGGHDGFVVVPALSDDGIQIDVFTAADVSAGPVATLKGPRRDRVPLLLHAAWMPRAVAPPMVERLRFSQDLAGDADLFALSEDLQQSVQRVAARLDEESAG